MRDDNDIVRDRQQAIRREMERRQILLKQVQLDGGWETVSTVASYFPLEGSNTQPATMSVAALYRLIRTGALPVDLLSMLLPNGFAIVKTPENIDHDELERLCRDYLAKKGAAHHPQSPEGREISTCEDDDLNRAATHLRLAA